MAKSLIHCSNMESIVCIMLTCIVAMRTCTGAIDGSPCSAHVGTATTHEVHGPRATEGGCHVPEENMFVCN